MDNINTEYVAFVGHNVLAAGNIDVVAASLHQHHQQADAPLALLFDGHTGKQLDLDLCGSLDETLSRLKEKFSRYASNVSSKSDLDVTQEPLQAEQGSQAGDQVTALRAKRGRPKLGVKGREVTLLPRHWEWLDAQQGGASATIRRLVENAKKEAVEHEASRAAQDATYRFVSAIAGNLPGYEEAIRALFARDQRRFVDEIQYWPEKVRRYALIFAGPVFAES